MKNTDLFKKFQKNTGYIFVCLILSVIAGIFLMTLVYSLPVGKMKEHVKNNLETYREENYSCFWAPGFFNSYLDIYTDALMQNAAVFPGSGSALKDAMNNPNVAAFADCTDPLEASVAYEGEQDAAINHYARYWHGYLVFLKPFLLFTDMSGIKMINVFLQFLLVIIVVLALFQVSGLKSVIPFVAAVLAVNPVSTVLCMQYATVYYIMLISALWLIIGKVYQSEKYWRLFLWIGIATAFFDYLTYPLAALGVNLICFLTLCKDGLHEKLCKTFFSSLAWFFGYAGMWAGKWLAAFLITGENVFLEAYRSIVFRISGDAMETVGVDSSSVFEVIWINLVQYRNFPVKLILLAAIFCVVCLCVFFHYRFRFESAVVLPVLLVSFYPFVWYGILRNHSSIHFWFTHRNLAVTIMGIACVTACSLKKKE